MRTRSVPAPRWRWCQSTGADCRFGPNRLEPKQDSHWRESKVAVLETYQSDVHQADPDPDVPRCFLDLKRTKEMVRGLGHSLPVGLEFGVEKPTSKQDEAAEEEGKASCPARADPSVWFAAF